MCEHEVDGLINKRSWRLKRVSLLTANEGNRKGRKLLPLDCEVRSCRLLNAHR